MWAFKWSFNLKLKNASNFSFYVKLISKVTPSAYKMPLKVKKNFSSQYVLIISLSQKLNMQCHKSLKLSLQGYSG